MGNRYYDGPETDHFDGKRFFLPGMPSADKGIADILRWRLGEKHAAWPEKVFTETQVKPDPTVSGLRITHIGHSSLLIQAGGANVLVDPVWSERASPVRFAGPKRRNPPAIRLEDLPRIDAVLVSHNHYDHMDVATLKQLWAAHKPVLLTPLGNDTIIRAVDRSIEVTTGDWWSEHSLPGDLGATIVPSYHWSSRVLGDYREALWGGFYLHTPVGKVYCAGDTAMRTGAIFAEMRERLGSPTMAVLPIGAYAPRWFMQTQHANPAEAVKIAGILGTDQVLGVHWGTFQLTDEPYAEPAEVLSRVAVRDGFRGTALPLRPGDVWNAAEG